MKPYGYALYFSPPVYHTVSVLYSRDHKGLDEKHHPKASLTFPDNDEVVLVSPNKPSDQPKMLSICCYEIKKKIIKRNFLVTEWLTD